MNLMDNEVVLEKLEQLMAARNISRYRLAKLSGIKLSTVTTIFNKRSTVSILNLSKMCSAFDLTLSEFFASIEGDPDSSVMCDFPMDWWRSLTDDERRKVSSMMFTIAGLCKRESTE